MEMSESEPEREDPNYVCEDVVEEVDEVNELPQNVIDKISALKTKREIVRSRKEKYETKIQEISKAMEDEHIAALIDLTKIHNGRMKYLNTFRNENLAKFDSYSKDLLLEIVLCEKMKKDSEDAVEKESTIKLPDPPLFVPGNVFSIGDVLGKLYVPSPSIVTKELTIRTTPIIKSMFKFRLKGLTSICITKGGEIWLAGEDSRELLKVGTDGHVLWRRNIKNRPCSLAAMDNNDLIISPSMEGSNYITRLPRVVGEQPVYRLFPIRYSFGISITADQKILICTVDGRVVMSNGDGTNAKDIYTGSPLHAVENMDGDIYISDTSKCTVEIISKDNGRLPPVTQTIEGEEFKSPGGLVVDKMGNILCADYGNNCVFIIDKNNQMRKLLGPTHGIKEPNWLAVNKDNNLWITQRDGNVKVVKYLERIS